MFDDPDSTDSDPTTYVDTPYGMLTATGKWYHIPEDEVRAYAGEVLDHVSLDRLLRWADAWGHSPRTVTLWTLPPLLWALSPAWAALSALGTFVGWALVSPALTSVVGARVGALLDHRLVQAGYYVAALSFFAAREQYAAVLVGLGAFVLFRWGIVRWALRPVLRPAWRWLYPLPVTDQVLRGLIVRVALKHRLALPQLDAITSDIMENWSARAQDEEKPPSQTDPRSD